MTEAQQDTLRAIRAAQAILDCRDPATNFGAIMVTTEHAIASLLILLTRDPRKAAAMLNEGLVQGVEERLARFAASKGNGQ